jgi:predicted enzyme related to lactoylglutathione lyase
LADVLAAAIDYADHGFPVSEIIAHQWRLTIGLLQHPEAVAAFTVDGRGPTLGEVVRLPDLARSLRAIAVGGAAAFYRAVLGIAVHVEKSPGYPFAVLEHRDGNGGCLVPAAGDISGTSGILVYLNANGRMREAVQQVARLGGRIVEPPKSIGTHGFRAIVIDSEGNRIALNAASDA